MKTNMNMNMKMKLDMKMNMNSCTKMMSMSDSFRGRRQRPQACESADPGGHEACGAKGGIPSNVRSFKV